MHNYYRYCENIASSYYPKIYYKLNRYIEIECNNYEESHEKLDFPLPNEFETMKKNIHEQYIKQENESIKNGESINLYNIDLRENIINDFIGILLLHEFLKRKEKYKNYPFFY